MQITRRQGGIGAGIFSLFFAGMRLSGLVTHRYTTCVVGGIGDMGGEECRVLVGVAAIIFSTMQYRSAER